MKRIKLLLVVETEHPADDLVDYVSWKIGALNERGDRIVSCKVVKDSAKQFRGGFLGYRNAKPKKT